MGKFKQPQGPLPEMDALFEGMQDLLTDEDGNPLPPDHPHYKKVENLAQLVKEFQEKSESSSSPDSPQGNA